MTGPLVPDALWALVAPLLPARPPRPKVGRPPLDDRKALEGIVFVLRTGIPWASLPKQMGCGSGMTCWRRLRDRQAAGVFERHHRALLERLGRANAIDFGRCSLDSATFPAKGGRLHRPTLAWFARFRRLTVRYDRRLDVLLGFHLLAAALICLRLVERWSCQASLPR